MTTNSYVKTGYIASDGKICIPVRMSLTHLRDLLWSLDHNVLSLESKESSMAQLGTSLSTPHEEDVLILVTMRDADDQMLSDELDRLTVWISGWISCCERLNRESK